MAKIRARMLRSGAVEIVEVLSHNRAVAITPEMRSEAYRRGEPLPSDLTHLHVLDVHGRKVQDEREVRHVLEPERASILMRRARRWLMSQARRRSRSGRPPRAPRHISYGIAAMQAVAREAMA